MQQRQLRLGDILDDYCPRERRVTNHVIVAMIAEDVKQVRCTTCDADHAFKHAKVPRQRRKSETPAALYAQVLATGPKRVTHEIPQTAGAASAASSVDAESAPEEERIESTAPATAAVPDTPEPDPVEAQSADEADADESGTDTRDEEEGPVHRPLIRASLPRIDGAPPPTRQIPEFTIRQPGGRPPNRFRSRHQRGGVGGGQQFQGNRSHGGGNAPGAPRGGMRSNGGRPPQGHGAAGPRRHGPGGRKRSK
jgi:hypothetical protein